LKPWLAVALSLLQTLLLALKIVDNAAILVNPAKTSEIKNALLEVIDNPILRADLSQKSIVRAANFSWEKTAKEHLTFFNKMNHLA
jgi:glycosyltransferase involved in cell wall biosynthesis